MKRLIALLSILMSVFGVYTAVVILLMEKHMAFGAICLLWFIWVLVRVGTWLGEEIKKFLKAKAFTMIELLAVITIAAILLTMTFKAFKVDRQKFDALQIKNDLNKVYHASLAYSDGMLEFDPDMSQYVSDIEFSHSELFFDKGSPVKADGSALLGYQVTIKDKKGQKKDMILYVRPFTGKITFNNFKD